MGSSRARFTFGQVAAILNDGDMQRRRGVEHRLNIV